MTRDPWQHQGVTVEEERQADGTVHPVATVFITGRECPWRCAMCDLWQYTTQADTPAGAVPAQIRAARETLSRTHAPDPPSCFKLYNASSFFDPRAVPIDDYPEIARALSGATRVVVESHPALVGHGLDALVDAFLDSAETAVVCPPHLEIAMGLETVHPEALERLNKRITAESFARASTTILDRGADLRAFLLVAPPFIQPAAQDEWLRRSVAFAADCGAAAVSLIASRGGNGTMEALADEGSFHPPTLADVERSLSTALTVVAGGRTRVFADLWNLESVAACSRCRQARLARLHAINLTQQSLPAVLCDACHGS